METRESKIHSEAVALWQALFGEEPPPAMDGATLLDLAMRNLTADSYARLRSPFLRPSTIVGPGQPTDCSSLD